MSECVTEWIGVGDGVVSCVFQAPSGGPCGEGRAVGWLMS